MVASDDAVMNGIKVGRYLQTYSKRDLGPRLGFAYDLTGSGKTIIRGGYGIFWNFTPRRHLVIEGAEPAVPAVDGADADPDRHGVNLLLKDGLPPPPGVDPTRPAAGSTRSIFDVNFRDAFARQWNVNVQQRLPDQLHGGGGGRRIAGTEHAHQGGPEPGAAGRGRDATRTSTGPYTVQAPALRTIGQVQSKGTLDYNALLVKFQRRFANNFSFLNSYTWGKAIDLNSDNDGTVTLTNVYDPQYNRGPADYDITHTLSSSWIYELPWAHGQGLRRLAAERHPAAPRRPAADGHADAGRALDRHRQPPEPDLRRQHLESDHRPLVRHVVLRAADRHHRHLRRCGPRHHPRAWLVQHRRLARSRTRSSAAITPSSGSRRSTC